jgi:hypothetical protein
MTFVCEVNKWYKNNLASELLHRDVGSTYECNLYRSEKGNYLLTHKVDFSTYGEAISEEEAKQLLQKNNYKMYEELFGEIEEA